MNIGFKFTHIFNFFISFTNNKSIWITIRFKFVLIVGFHVRIESFPRLVSYMITIVKGFFQPFFVYKLKIKFNVW